MKKLTMLVGCPGSGKSTYAAQASDCVRLNMDTLRQEILGNASCQAYAALIGLLLEARLHNALATGRDIVLDNTNIYSKFRKPIIDKAIEAGYSVEIVWVDTDLETCLQRNRNRERKVPEIVILRMYAALSLAENTPSFETDGVPVRRISAPVLVGTNT